MSMASSTQTAGSSPYQSTRNKLLWVFIAAAIIGWFASIFLVLVHVFGLPVLDLPEDVTGSIAVIQSPWAYIGPVPLALLGAGYYLAMLVLGGLWMQTKDERLELPIIGITVIGVIASAYFVYLQLVPIGFICPFCMMSAAATTTIFIVEIAIKKLGGASEVPPIPASHVWPVIVGGTLVLTVLAIYGVTLAPFPGGNPF